MKERPILFSASMVCAILKGSKTQTRRVVKPQPDGDAIITVGEIGTSRGAAYVRYPNEGGICSRFPCPYGQPGDRLWVREACQGWTFEISGENVVRYPADSSFSQIENLINGADRWIDLYNYRRKRGAIVPSIHMPRWASRILLEITNMRVERLQDISCADAKAEGIERSRDGMMWRDYISASHAQINPIDSYRTLWESINGPGSWDANPWVWVIEFKSVKP